MPDESQLVEEYRGCKALYQDFASKVSEILTQIVADRGIKLHSITHRPKDEESLTKKLRRPGGEYQTLKDITDLAGVRVITYFHDQVDRIAEIVEAEFSVDFENSIDKRKLLDPDRFGYLSLHYVVELSAERCALGEYSRLKGLKAEIQIRSMLQHVWAEIEHDLGYKSSKSVPAATRRRFARLAGLLELADAEFADIRDYLLDYEKKVPALIAETPASVFLDLTSLTAFKNNNQLARELDQYIASLVGDDIKISDPRVTEGEPARLEIFGISTIQELDLALCEHQEDIRRLARALLEGKKPRAINQGTCIIYLQCVYFLKRHDRELARQWAASFMPDKAGKKILDGLFEAGERAGILGAKELQ